jgi:hypothetical protein
VLLSCLAFLAQADIAYAADHTESPATTADRAADIADLFVFSPVIGGSERLVVVLTYGGDSSFNPISGDLDFYCDRDVLYSVYLDDTANNAADAYASATADVTMNIRMTAQADGSCDVRFENVPGAGSRFEGKVGNGTDIVQSSNGLNGFVGTADDPFFFDLQGFVETLNTGTLAFDNTRDVFAGRNLSAIAFEIDESAIGSSGTQYRLWATSARYVE